MVEEDAHLGGSQRTPCCVFEDSSNLLRLYAREPFDELRRRRTVLEILEERGYRDAGTTKYPRATNPCRVALHCGA